MSADGHAPGHPAPSRGAVPFWRQAFGILGGPVAWAVQFNLGYGLTSYACYPGDNALPHVVAGWGWTRPTAAGLALVAGFVALLAASTSWATWRATRDEKAEHSEHVLEAGEGRTRFLAVCGLLTSLGFLAAIGFDLVMIVWAPACHG